eukprot:UN03744
MIKELKRKYNFDFYDPFFYQQQQQQNNNNNNNNTENDQHDWLAINKLKLTRIAEKLKRTLSTMQSVQEYGIILKGMFNLLTKEQCQKLKCTDGFELTLDRIILNKYFSSNKSPGRIKSIRSIQRALNKAGLKLTDINKVVLVGGSTRIPAIQKNLISLFNNNPDIIAKTLNADEAVALGACIHAATLSTSPNQQLILPTNDNNNNNNNSNDTTATTGTTKRSIQLCDISPLAYGLYVIPHATTHNLYDDNDHDPNEEQDTIPDLSLYDNIESNPIYDTFVTRNTLLLKDRPVQIEKLLLLPYDPKTGKMTIQILEYDDAIDSTEVLTNS